MNDIGDKLPDGRAVEKVKVKIPPEMAQIFTRIVQVEQRLKNATSVTEGIAFAHQFSLVAAKASKDVAKFAVKQPEHELDLRNVAEEFEILSAMASKVWSVVKAHQRMTPDNAIRRNQAFADLSKTSQNAGAAIREYLLTLGDAQKAQEALDAPTSPAPQETLPEAPPEAPEAT